MGKGTGRGCRLCLGGLFPCCILSGVVLLGLAVALYVKFPDVITDQVNKRVTVQKGHATYEQLQQPSIPIFKDFYFFNLTNAVEFASSNGGATPVLEERGPYSFTELRVKTLGEPKDDQISYTQRKTYYFNASTSHPNVSQDDKICTINIPLVAAINEAKDSYLLRVALRGIITVTGAKLYICQPAIKLAWNYTDSFLEALHLGRQFPSKYINIQVNDSLDDRNESIINTGSKDISQIGQYIQWNGKRQLTIWPDGTGANFINGTEGLFFRPNLVEGDNLTAFKDDIFRSIDLIYQGTIKPLGMKAFRYGIDNRTFVGAFNESANARWKSWCPDGMFYLGVTQPKEPPIFGSKPHFLDGSSWLIKQVKGLEPADREKHDTIIDVEPTTGANVHLQQQLQINLQVNRTEKRSIIQFPMHELNNVTGYNNSETLYYPVLYINEHAIMDPAFKQYLESKGLKEVQIFNRAVPIVFGVMIFVGVVCLLISLFACAGFVSKSRRREDDGSHTPLLNPSN